jgi:hypothetical protein
MARKPAPKFIHVNQQRIRANLKHGTDDPVITIKQGSKNTYAHEVAIDGPSTILYSGAGRCDPLLRCGARVAIKTDAPVRVLR